MLFSSLIFLFFFLPVVLPLALVKNIRLQNILLLIASLIFYGWGGVSFTLIMIGSIVLNYILGILIGNSKSERTKRILLTSGISINLLSLIIFKYLNFLVSSYNDVFPWQLKQTSIALPIGISFFTFHGLSYIIDIYRGKIKPQKDFAILALYIALFPQLIAGPIIRYKDIYKQFELRHPSFAKFAYGVKRFIIGLGKKVIIANTFALLADNIFKMEVGSISMSTAWLGIISYTIQIYFDFSGYSDMAVGLGRMFGFIIPENFNLPYIATSIQDFWRRWHISLSTWFRDYLYISLGGNKHGELKMYRNLLIVFFLCGLWHGASWAFIAWGLYHGLFLIIERIGVNNILNKLWSPIRHVYVLLVVMIGWVFFRSETFTFAFHFIGNMFGANYQSSGLTNARFYLTNEIIICFFIAVVFSTTLPKLIYLKLKEVLINNRVSYSIVFRVGQNLISLIFLGGIFSLCVMYLASSSYNPFIYFRF